MMKSSRSFHSKSRSGCLRCKSDRIKCDEQKPACLRCRARKAVCPGYQTTLRWPSKHQRVLNRNSRQAPIISLSPSADAQAYVENASNAKLDTTPQVREASPAPNPIFMAESDLHVSNSQFLPEFIDFSDLFNTNSPGFLDVGDERGFENASSPRLQPVETPKDQENVVDIVRQPESDISVERPVEIFNLPSTLCNYFFKEVIPLYCAWDGKTNGMRILAEKFWQKSGTLYHTMQSMSAACLVDSFPHLASVAVQERNQAISFFHSSSASGTPLGEDHILAAQLLGHTASWHDPQDLAISQFQESHTLLHEWVSQCDSEHVGFFEEGRDYWAMLLSFVTDKSCLGLSEKFVGPEEPIATTHALLPHPWSGISGQTVKTVTDIGLHISQYCKRFSVTRRLTEHDVDVFRAALKESRALEWRILTSTMVKPSDLLDPGDGRTTTAHLSNIEEAYRYTGLLQLYRVFPDLLIDRFNPWDEKNILRVQSASKPSTREERDIWLTKFALHILNLLRQISFDSGTRCVQPLILVAVSGELRGVGSSLDPMAIEVAQARQFVRARLSMYSYILPLTKVRKILELVSSIWAALDAGETDVYWVDVAYEKKLRTIMG